METVLTVKGMSCAHCEKSVKDSVGGLTGVKEVEVQLDTGKVTIEHDEAITSKVEIEATIEEQGYDVVK